MSIFPTPNLEISIFPVPSQSVGGYISVKSNLRGANCDVERHLAKELRAVKADLMPTGQIMLLMRGPISH